MGEIAAVARLQRRLPAAPEGETWIGDDAAVVDDGLLLATDSVVAGVHAPAGAPLADLGYRAVVRNVSDIAAMGGRPRHLLVAVVGPPATDVDGLFDGVIAAAQEYGCAVVGGDLAAGLELVVTVGITGRCADGRAVLRSGASAGDVVCVTGVLGGAAAGGYAARPVARVREGEAARRAGATAMIDVSDGLFIDARRLAQASGVGLVIDSDLVPVAAGATWEQATGGGEDYELVFTMPPDVAVPAGAVVIGRCTDDPADIPPATGWQHPFR